MKLRKMIKKEARTALRGNRGVAVALLLVVMAISMAINMADAAAIRLLGYNFSWEALDSFSYSSGFFYELPALVVTLLTMLVRLALAVPLCYGVYNWHLELTDRRLHGVSHIFWPYECRAAGRGVLLSLNVGVKLFLIAPLLMVGPLALAFAGDTPGLPEALAVGLVWCGLGLLLAALALLWAFAQRFAIAPLLLCEKYQLTTHEAIKQSVRFTRGYRWELVRFRLSFLPWLLPLLGCAGMMTFSLVYDVYSIMPVVWMGLTLLVGLVTHLWLAPYYQMSLVMFTRYLYEDGLRQQHMAKAAAAISVAPAPAPESPAPDAETPAPAPESPAPNAEAPAPAPEEIAPVVEEFMPNSENSPNVPLDLSTDEEEPMN